MPAVGAFAPLRPDRLVAELAGWVRRSRSGDRPSTVVGFDGPAEGGIGTLADEVAEALSHSGCAVVRASTAWWWRPAALRLEMGRQDIDMLLTGWVDDAALRRELLEPAAGGGSYISRLRDPDTDRPVRQPPVRAPDRPVVLLDGPFLLATELPLDAVVGFRIGDSALARALPVHRQWWVEAFRTYAQRYEPQDRADVLISYDHPASPAAVGLADGRR